MPRKISLPSRPATRRAWLAAVPLTAALALSGCAAGSHSPQYEEHTTSDFTNADLPGGLVLDGGYISTPAKKGGHAVATFDLSVLTGDGGTLTGVTSPVAQGTEIALLNGNKLVSSVSVQPSQSQTPVKIAVALEGLTQDLKVGYFYDVDIALAQSATPVRLQFPVLRAGQNPDGNVFPTVLS